MAATELLANPSMFLNGAGAGQHEPSPESQLCFAAEYLHNCSLYEGATPETLRGHLIDTLVVPTLRPESCRAMLPFAEGVETLADAERRLQELALLLALICGGVNRCVSLVDVPWDPLPMLAQVRPCLDWAVQEGKLGRLRSKECPKKKLQQRCKRVLRLFRRGLALLLEHGKGVLPTSAAPAACVAISKTVSGSKFRAKVAGGLGSKGKRPAADGKLRPSKRRRETS
jgi:hypothetical protein